MANKIQLVNNRVEIAKSYLLSQFRDKPNILALVEVLVEELQELENTIIELQEVRTLAGAKGWWLDRIGEELDTPRDGFSDADYKTVLRLAMLKQTASATIDDIIKILSFISNDSELRVTNPNKYLIEAVGYLFGVKDSMLQEVAELFPLNTRKLIVQRETKPFKFGTVGRGFGSGSQLNNILLYSTGVENDRRFVSVPTEKYIPPISNSPTLKTNPYIFGDGLVGSTLTYVDGEFNGVTPITVTKQWQANNVDISGATGSTYTLVTADAGKIITVKTTATNTDGTLVIYSNTINVSNDIPASNALVDDLGLSDFSTFEIEAYDGLTSTATQSITFNVDGSITFTRANGGTFTSAYLTNVGDHHGQDYTLRYVVLSGDDLIGLPENTSRELDTALTLSQSVTSKTTKSVEGNYRFTIFKTTDPTITKSVDIYMSVTLRKEL